MIKSNDGSESQFLPLILILFVGSGCAAIFNMPAVTVSPSVRTDGLETFERENPEFIKAALQNVPLGRFGDPIKDVGPLALFLGSSDSDFITGMTFMLDGGLFMYP